MFRHSMGAITRKCSQWLKSCFRNVSVVHTTDHFAGTCGRRFCACVHVPVHVGLTDSTHSEHTDRNIYGSYTDRLLLFFRACSISGVSWLFVKLYICLSRSKLLLTASEHSTLPPASTPVSNVMLKTLQINNRKSGEAGWFVCTHGNWSLRRRTNTSFDFC